jgi:hypothetical protein
MKWLNNILESNLNAVLITVLIHLVLVFIFLLMQLHPPEQQKEATIIIDPEKLEEMEKYFEAKEKIEKEMQEEALSKNMTIEEIRNLARTANIEAEKQASDKQQTAKEIQEKYEEELRKEMYGDKYEEIKAELDKEISRDDFSEYRQTPESMDKKGDADYYTGPSLVKVELENKDLRHHYIDIPVFTCRGSGVVVVGITVDNFGNVVNANTLSAPEHVDSNCLIQAAKQAAMNSRFASSQNGTSGEITYHFIPQD